MTLVISKNLVLSQSDISENAGIIGYKNIVTHGVISASSEQALNPATNMANPATAFGWEAADTATQIITVAAGGQEVDYIGIAKHNLSQPGLVLTLKFNGIVVATRTDISDSQAILFLVNLAAPTTIILEISGATIAPKIAVLYVGQSILLERNIYVGHTPITMGYDRDTVNGISQSGQYLGEIIRNESLVGNITLMNLHPDWYRTTLDPCIKRKPRHPMFYVWRPADYPSEVAYCWIVGNPKPVNQRNNGMMQISIDLRGVS